SATCGVDKLTSSYIVPLRANPFIGHGPANTSVALRRCTGGSMRDKVGAIAKAIEALSRQRHAEPGGRPDVLVGLVGRGIQLSRSPAMHESEAARLGLSCAYLLIDFDTMELGDADLEPALAAAAGLGFHGV